MSGASVSFGIGANSGGSDVVSDGATPDKTAEASACPKSNEEHLTLTVRGENAPPVPGTHPQTAPFPATSLPKIAPEVGISQLQPALKGVVLTGQETLWTPVVPDAKKVPINTSVTTVIPEV